MNDAQIVALFWQRKEAAILEAQNRYGAYCRSIASHILNSGYRLSSADPS